MRFIFPVLLIYTLFAMVSCGGGKSAADTSLYGIKSGSYTYSMELPGMGPILTTTYFDDYGKKQTTDSKNEMTMFGQTIKTHTRTVTKDGYVYNLDMINKTGTRTRMDAEAGKAIKGDFAAMAASMKDQIKIKELGEETFLDRKCRKIEVLMKDGKSMGTFWLWKNITLKMVASDERSGASFTLAAVKVDDKTAVPADMFTVPADFKISEVTMNNPAAEE